MFTPRVPTNPAPTGQVPPALTPTAITHHDQMNGAGPCTCHTPAPVASRPTVQLTPSALIALAVGGTTTVLVIGAVLVSLLLAVALTGASLAICALVIRSLVNTQAKQR
ncbi:SpdD-like protein [Streptomyces spectabilis]|uniref:SpdD-like protein n=1 Tax=Streptomyces spectabilis TaxID=68270 RepID=UPI0033F74A9A